MTAVETSPAVKISAVRPGLLVSLKTTLTGNVSYQRYETETEHLTEFGEKRSAWETTKTITDPAEHERAVQVRSKCRNGITAVCTLSSFGLLCREDDGAKLQAAIAEAQASAQQFNTEALATRIGVYIVIGRVAPDDVQYIRSVKSEVRDLIDAMTAGVAALDVTAVRTAAQKARNLAEMLQPNAASKVQEAVRTARQVARRMVKAGEQAAQEVDAAILRRISEARLAFLDIELAPPAVEAEAVSYDQGRVIDLVPDNPSGSIVQSWTPVRNLEIPDQNFENAGKALNAAYPWGYRSNDIEI